MSSFSVSVIDRERWEKKIPKNSFGMKASKFPVQEKLQSTTKNKFGLPLKKEMDFNSIVVKISHVFSRHVVLWSILKG